MGFKKLPGLRAREVIHCLAQLGFRRLRQRGSHVILYHSETKRRTVVPIHGGATIKKPLLAGIIEDTGLSIDEFLRLLRKQ